MTMNDDLKANLSIKKISWPKMSRESLMRYPVHTAAFSIFPILALLAHNIHELDSSVALRPVFVSLSFSLAMLIIFRLVFKELQKAALATTLLLILFFSYGHVYRTIREIPTIGLDIARHRYLVVLFLALTILGVWAIQRYIIYPDSMTQTLNIITILLLISPLYQITRQSLQTSAAKKEVLQTELTVQLVADQPNHLPDIYFIVLDSYTRADALLNDLGYDNSPFLDELREIGFYIADCSRSNYDYTHASITSSLNMNYIPELRDELTGHGSNLDDVWILLKQSMVRRLLERLGYITVAFESGFEWSRISDADVYLEYTGEPYEMQTLTPFESMLIKNTGLLLWVDATYKAMPDYISTAFSGVNFPIEDHINRQMFILDQLPKIANRSLHKFVFAHILIPHVPYVFAPDGEIISDPAFYGGEKYAPYDDEHLIEGYVNGIQFINHKMTSIFRHIIAESDYPPMIILMGDHGLQGDNRLQILNAYYVPEDVSQAFYPTISPVNTFRVIFNGFFKTEYPLLPDLSYTENTILTPETSLICTSD
jgi:hypothetical protein